MIISASRRTDIPSYYTEWFFNRLRAGYVYVRNPMNPHQVSEVSLSRDVVDGIVFWTKNPIPMLDRLHELQDYTYYFQFTLTPYGTDVEKHIPPKKERIIPAFRRLSAQIGKERVVWRYDPILLSEKYTVRYHVRAFRELCDRLADCTEQCTISFLDLYRGIKRGMASLSIYPPSSEQAEELAESFGAIAREYGIEINTCAEAMDLSRYGIGHAACIDRRRLERIGNTVLDVKRDKNQRTACGCVASIDIGAYNTCGNGCAYCYANYNRKLVGDCFSGHDPVSPLLYGSISEEDRIMPRKMLRYSRGKR